MIGVLIILKYDRKDYCVTENNNLDSPSNNIQSQPEDLKKSAYYSAMYNAFMATLIEADKSILAVSAGGIGLLVTLLNVFQLKSIWHVIIYLIALIFFVISIISSIFIFKRNKVVLMNMLMDKSETDSILTFLDYLNFICCILGILLTICIGLSAGIQKLDAKPTTDVDKVVKMVQITTLNGNVVLQGYTNFTSNQRGKNNGK